MSSEQCHHEKEQSFWYRWIYCGAVSDVGVSDRMTLASTPAICEYFDGFFILLKL
jgi:hypothetical protein